MSTTSSDLARLVIRLAIFVVLVAGLQALVHAIAPNRDVPAALRLCDEYLRNGVDILYFGDSTLYRGDPEEGPSETLPELLAARLPEYRVGAIAHDAYHPDLYAAFCRYLARQPQRPRAVVIPINLRAFSVERDRRPEYQFAREKWFLEHTSFVSRAIFHPLAAWGAINLTPVTQQDYQDTEVFDGVTLLGTVGDLGAHYEASTEEGRARAFIDLFYRYSLESGHRQLRALKDIVETCSAADIQPVFYVTPVDCDLGERLAGSWFPERIRANAAAIVRTVQDAGAQATIMDLSCSLDASHFALKDLPDAYLRSSGKVMLAERVAVAVESALESPLGGASALGDPLRP